MPKATQQQPQLPYAFNPNAAPGVNNKARKDYLASVATALQAKGINEASPEYKQLMGMVERQLVASTNQASIPALTKPGQTDPTKGGSGSSASGAAPAGSGFVGWLNPMNGSTFFGILPNGQRQVITRAQAEALGAPPEKRSTGDFYGYKPDDPRYEPPPPPIGGGGGGGGNGGGGNGGGGGGSGGGGGGSSGGGGGGQGSWGGWGQGAPSMDGGGGYNPNDYAYQWYVPGRESPWGIPEARGGNKDFYRNQFVNLLQHSQNAQLEEMASALRRAGAEKNPIKPVDYAKAWESMNLPKVTVTEGGYATPI